jgi:Fe-S cluster assembly protein SufA/iron-sulfur cluster assembly protein
MNSIKDSVSIYDPAAEKTAVVSFTPAAIAHLKKDIQRHQANGLRLGLKKAGCSGFKYVIDYVYQPEKTAHEIITIEKDFVVYIDAESLPALRGVTIDYVREGLNGALKFNNPNEKAQCGCGESFST